MIRIQNNKRRNKDKNNKNYNLQESPEKKKKTKEKYKRKQKNIQPNTIEREQFSHRAKYDGLAGSVIYVLNLPVHEPGTKTRKAIILSDWYTLYCAL